MSLAFLPKSWTELEGILIEFNRRLDNLDGVRGNKLSHKKLKDIDDHSHFVKTEGTRIDVGSDLSEAATNADIVKSLNDLKSKLRNINIKT